MNHVVFRSIIQAGLIAVLVCVGCGPTLQVRTDFDHTVSFTSTRRSRWLTEK